MSLDLLVARMKSAGAQRVYKVGNVPASPGDAYAVLSLTTPRTVSRRTSGDTSASQRILSAQCFGRSEEAVMDMAEYADEAFQEKALTEFPREPFCTRDLNIGPTRDPDGGGWLYILHTYRF